MAYNLLMIDDSKIVRKSLRKTLAMTDIEVGQFLEAGDGKEGLEVLRSNWVDLVFLDINMPVMNGMEFMEELVKDEEYKNTPVVIVSTEGSVERRNRLTELGIKSYLRKPVTPEAVVEVVNELLGE